MLLISCEKENRFGLSVLMNGVYKKKNDKAMRLRMKKITSFVSLFVFHEKNTESFTQERNKSKFFRMEHVTL